MARRVGRFGGYCTLKRLDGKKAFFLIFLDFQFHSTPMVNGFDHSSNIDTTATTTTTTTTTTTESDSSIATTSATTTTANANTTSSSDANTSSTQVTTTTTTISLVLTPETFTATTSSAVLDTPIGVDATMGATSSLPVIPGIQPTEEETAVQAVRNHVESLKHTGKIFIWLFSLHAILFLVYFKFAT